MSIKIISINDIHQKGSSAVAAGVGNQISYDGVPKRVADDDDDDNHNEVAIMTLHRECKDDDMYNSSATPTVLVENQVQMNEQLPQLQPHQIDFDDTITDTTTGHPISSSSQPLPNLLPIMIVSNKCETIYVSSDGDVLTSRCRYTPYPTVSSKSLTFLSGDNDNSNGANPHANHHNSSSFPWSTNGGHSNILAAVVCCDHLVHHHHPNNSNMDPHNDSHPDHHNLDRNEPPVNSRYSSSDKYKNNDSDRMNHTSSAFAPAHHNNDPNTNTATYSNYRNDDNIHTNSIDTKVDDDDVNGDSCNPNYNRSISLIKSFDYSQYSETGGMDETQWSSPISRNTGNDNTAVPDATTAVTTSRTAALHSNNQNSISTTSLPRRQQQQQQHPRQQQLFHGIPTFVSYFSSIKVRNVSAHPMGAHVLLISHPGILYAYGLNTYGQLGIGWKSHSRDIHQGYVMRPTIVTSLLENGGKTISCAAGVSHSLVVVEVEERRIFKSQSLEMITQKQPRGISSSVLRTRQQNDGGPNDTHESEIVKYHQMYGFGRNDYMKIGLINPKVAVSSTHSTISSTPMSGNVSISLTNHNTEQIENVLFPRRVALRCSVIHKKVNDPHGDDRSLPVPIGTSAMLFPPKGIFAIAASTEHSAALVHQANGDIELYTWGNATYGTLGLPPSSFVTPPLSTTASAATTTAFRVAPYPSLVACLSKTSNSDARTPRLLRTDIDEFPTSMSLSRCCSFVATNLGRCFSFGTSEDGMLGLGRSITETQTPMEIALPEDAQPEKIISVSAGTLHVTVCTDAGHVYSWGSRSHAGFDIQTSSTMSQQQRKPPTIMKEPTPIEELIQFEWSPRRVDFSNSTIQGRSKSYHTTDDIQKIPKIVQARAGNDCTFFITDCGKVLSSGKSSGRLGQGEYDTDITIPKPLFGGLHLFQQKENHHSFSTSNHTDDITHPKSTATTTTTSLRSKARRLASV